MLVLRVLPAPRACARAPLAPQHLSTLSTVSTSTYDHRAPVAPLAPLKCDQTLSLSALPACSLAFSWAGLSAASREPAVPRSRLRRRRRARPRRRAAQAAPALDESRAAQLKTRRSRDPTDAATRVQLGEHVLRRGALPGRRRVVRGRAEDHAEGRQRQHRPRHRVLLHEPARPRARAVRPLARHRSVARARRSEHRHRARVRRSRISRAPPTRGRKCSRSRPTPRRRARRVRRWTASVRRIRTSVAQAASARCCAAPRPHALPDSSSEPSCAGAARDLPRAIARRRARRRRPAVRWCGIRCAARSSCPRARCRPAPDRSMRFFCSERCRDAWSRR